MYLPINLESQAIQSRLPYFPIYTALMPKIQKLRKHVLAHNPYKGVEATSNKEAEETQVVLSKGQKKRQLKKEKIRTKIGLISPVFKNSLKKKNAEAKDKLLSELESNLKMNLNEDGDNNTVIKAAADTSLKSNKMKKAVAVREAARMKLVQQHPAFIENPIAAINLHLQQMISNKLQAKTNTAPSSTKKK